MNSFTYKDIEYKSGDAIIFKINGVVIRGKLYVKKHQKSENYVNAYVCHNNEIFDGECASDKFGYDYSWSFLFDLNDTDPFSGSDVIILCHDIESNKKENFQVSDEFENFLSTKELELISLLLERECIFKQYNKFEISEKTGYIKLTDTDKNRFVDIKFGRFLTTLFTTFKDLYKFEIYTNRDIENFYNSFVSFQSDSCIELVELKGDEIIEAYKSENYLYKKSSLGGSCMTDNTDYLKLYTSNPDIVSLLAIKTYGKIVGRCLIWNTNQGRIMDKRYTCFDWVNSKFETIIEKSNYICCSTLEDYPNGQNKIDIKLENFEELKDIKYPYLDTFKYFNTVQGFLTNTINEDMQASTEQEKKDFLILTRTDGGTYTI
jgi:hypothetical protein